MNVDKLIIVCDASVHIPDAHLPGRRKRGKAACGVIFLNGQKRLSEKIEERGKYLGEMTVPEAEYNALVFALNAACELCRRELEVWLDSELVVRHLTAQYRLKAVNLKPLFDEVRKLEARFNKVAYFHHARDNQLAQEADKVAHQFLDEYS